MQTLRIIFREDALILPGMKIAIVGALWKLHAGFNFIQAVSACLETEYTLVRERNLNEIYMYISNIYYIDLLANIIYQHEINVEDKSVLSVTQNYAGTKTKK